MCNEFSSNWPDSKEVKWYFFTFTYKFKMGRKFSIIQTKNISKNIKPISWNNEECNKPQIMPTISEKNLHVLVTTFMVTMKHKLFGKIFF